MYMCVQVYLPINLRSVAVIKIPFLSHWGCSPNLKPLRLFSKYEAIEVVDVCLFHGFILSSLFSSFFDCGALCM